MGAPATPAVWQAAQAAAYTSSPDLPAPAAGAAAGAGTAAATGTTSPSRRTCATGTMRAWTADGEFWISSKAFPPIKLARKYIAKPNTVRAIRIAPNSLKNRSSALLTRPSGEVETQTAP